MISGLKLTPLRCIDGPSGAVLHALKCSSDSFVGFGEAYFSEVHEGAVKSWRRHREVTTNLVVPVGAVRFVVYDDAPSRSEGEKFSDFRLGRTPDTYARLTIPPGLWFAFQGVGPGTSLLLSIIDAEHDPTEADTCELTTFSYNWK